MVDYSLRQLVDERAIERALILFARAMDDRDWATMERILADDAEGDFGTGRVTGRSAVINLVRGYLDNCGVNASNDPATRMYTLGDYRDAWRRSADGSWSLVERVKINRGFVGTLEVFEEKSR
ncbi:hypothetical protein MycrhDRAFT_3838 [Mycolicibacterium rhodesiae JS60]|nr:hypothetical protein MycrhDRAFT_3838 [Mycolicibacterium rhodesiae JS60]